LFEPPSDYILEALFDRSTADCQFQGDETYAL